MPLKKILVADDEPDVLAILEKKLKQSGYDVLALSKGKEIIVKVKSFQPDLLILDIVMPDMDGYAVGITLRQDEATKKTPIIFMTGKELEFSGMQKRAEALGYCDIINKPCTFEELLVKVNAVLK
ncbi:MAG: response regulator [Candidatus Omnitrophica bacterium]|nr:response regulator [Candidatus Omnitrophota bacterium]